MAVILRYLWPSTLVGRTLLVFLLALGSLHVVSVGLHHQVLSTAVLHTNDTTMAERITAIRQALAAQAPERREAEAHALSGPGIEAHWDTTPVLRATDGDASPGRPDGLEAQLRNTLAAIGAPEVRLAFEGEPGEGGRGHLALISVALPDGTWLNVQAARSAVVNRQDAGFWSSLSLMALGIIVVSVLVVRNLTAPLRDLAAAADALDPNGGGADLPEDGPKEVRHTAAAFNRMRARIRRIFEEQTRALAAMGHDIMLPIARLKYRVDMLEDPEQRAQFARDLSEMEAMARATLDFVRSGTETETPRHFDLSAMLRTICDDLADRGADVAYEGPDQLAMRGRHLALKRGMANLIENAVRHGAGTAVKVALHPPDRDRREIVIAVDDSGPGIPEAELDRVCEPFYRVDKARGRDTGGSGLGLAVAKATVERHGGRLALHNRPGSGLSATVALPVKP
jgi:signal transduction histidine kinase